MYLEKIKHCCCIVLMKSTTTAASKVVSSSTLIGPFEFERALKFNGGSRSRSNSKGPIRVEDETTLQEAVVADLITEINATQRGYKTP